MRLVHMILIIGLLPAAAAAEVEFGQSQGSFPVFGPSAEREAYFAEQETERREAIEARRLERERERERQAELERLEVMREIAEAEARARETEAARRNILVNCVVVPPKYGPGPTGRVSRQGAGTVASGTIMPPLKPAPGRPGPYPYPPAAPEYTGYRVNCLPASSIVLPYRLVQPNSTELSVSVDGGDVSGSVTVRRPGIGLGFGF